MKSKGDTNIIIFIVGFFVWGLLVFPFTLHMHSCGFYSDSDALLINYGISILIGLLIYFNNKDKR